MAKKGMLSEFKEFIATGNVIDLAVGVIMGAAIGAVIKAFVDGIMMQIVAAIFGQPDFSTIKWTLRKNVATVDGKTVDSTLQIGAFINTLISLVLTGLVLFMIVKAVNKMNARKAVDAPPAGPSEVDLLTEIRDSLKSR